MCYPKFNSRFSNRLITKRIKNGEALQACPAGGSGPVGESVGRGIQAMVFRTLRGHGHPATVPETAEDHTVTRRGCMTGWNTAGMLHF